MYIHTSDLGCMSGVNYISFQHIMHTYIHTFMCTYMYTHITVELRLLSAHPAKADKTSRAHTHTHTHTHTHMHIHANTHTCMHAHIQTYMYPHIRSEQCLLSAHSAKADKTSRVHTHIHANTTHIHACTHTNLHVSTYQG